jgi:hypothetical protein
MPHATFVLSTGRCGTQWLAEAFRAGGCGRARVEHEPLHNDYVPRQMLGAADPGALGARGQRLLRHAEEIERTLAERDYIETGHPSWSSVPWLARRLAGRVRVIHLVRHPVPTACSWVSHGAFVPPLLPHLRLKELIAPADAGVSFPEYAGRWSGLTPFEKALVYWAEVNAFALRLEALGELPWRRVRYEDLFGDEGQTLAGIMEFSGAGGLEAGALPRSACVDRHRFALAAWPEFARLAEHPDVAQLAARFGYRLEDFPVEQIAARFMLAGQQPG